MMGHKNRIDLPRWTIGTEADFIETGKQLAKSMPIRTGHHDHDAR